MKPKTLVRHFLLLLLLAISFTGYSQNRASFKIKEIGTPFINTYFPSDYGAHEQTYHFAQSKTGLIYVAGVTGVLEFDGQEWSVDSRLSDDAFKGVYAAQDGRVYAATKSLIGYFSPDSIGQMTFRNLNNKVSEDFKGWGNFWQVDHSGEQIVFNSTRQLVVYDPHSDTTSLLSPSKSFGKSRNIHGDYYVVDYGRGLLKITNGQLKLMPGSELLSEYTVRGITSFSDDELLIATNGHGLLKYGPEGLEPWETEVTNFLKQSEVFAITSIHDQYYAVGTATAGMVIIDRNGRLIQKLDKDMGMGNNGLIQDIFLDKDSNLWVAQHGVISHIIINSPFTTLDERQGVNGYVLYFQRHAGKIYVSTTTGTVVKEESQPWQKLGNYKPFAPISSSKQRVWMSIKHEEDFFLAGNDGLAQVGKNGLRPLYKGERLWAAVALKDLPHMVLGSIEGNLFLFSKKNGRWSFQHKIEGFNQQMDFLEQTEDGDLWMTDSGTGVFKISLNASRDSVISIRNYGKEDGLPATDRNRVFRHSDGLYFATVEGVFQYVEETDSFRGVEKFNKHLSSDYVFRLIEMQNGSVYASLNPRGKALLSPEAGNFEFTQNPFQRISGHNSEYVADMGTKAIWIAGSGIKHYDQSFNAIKHAGFKAWIRSVRISNHNDSLIYGGAGLQPEIDLNTGENAMQFTFSASFFDELENLEFQSYLQGSEETWSSWTSKSSRNYTNLPHGTYTLKLRARNVYGEISETDEFTFKIITPWYLTVWAYVLYTALLALLVRGIVMINSRMLVKEKEALERTVLQRTDEIRKQKERAEEDKELIQQQADRLKELDKVKSRFFANISHELRTPLTLINAPLESLINSGEIKNEEVTNTLKTAQRNGVSLLSLVEEILDLGKLQAGKLKLVKNPVRLKEYIEDILNSYQSGLAGKNIDLKFEFELDENFAMLMDENKCGKVIKNLLSNALKFTNDEITVNVRRNSENEGFIRISVIDNGVGIHQNDLPYIFDRYYQSEEPGKKAEGGTGIGLALAKELAVLHEGNLTVSSNLGKGSTFIFDIPAVEVKEETIVPLIKADSEKLEAALQDTVRRYSEKFDVDKPLLLITEDHPEMRAFIAKTLAPYFSILQAENGKVALNMLKTQNVDIVISDVMMPEMDGFELLEAIRKNESLHEVSVIMLTARTDHEDKLHALTLGIDDYLTKPFSAEEFLARIKNILENRIKIIREFKGLTTLVNGKNRKSNLEKLEKKYGLSEREIQVMQLLAERYSNPEIAEQLFVSRNTVKYHIKNLFGKLDIKSRVEAADKIDEILN